MNAISFQRGAGLIEVMVTVLILSTSLLGLAALQNRSLQYNHSAYLRSQANILAYDILDRARINRANLTSYSLAATDDAPTATGLAPTDLREWRESLAAALPEGSGGIECSAVTRICTVTIQWAERDGVGVDGDTEASRFQYSTRI
ncbi:type IV pilus modification protein PilV [Microbulbifer yueqingensis]|uniref:Type IV pilus assembly protein PilV n=1 Tax=Microbulbifer yueqingensis TaxID=658219 RepID=A0A1G9EVT5_9GAMM|nr:type IV pilus modification protein PilV [Microbulbifer yueqingensis]SDK80276.1 type IV pilus assembly protein PilV [Microbulbifer yueqingensis]